MLVVRNQHVLNQVNWLLVIRLIFVWINIAQNLFLDKITQNNGQADIFVTGNLISRSQKKM